MRALLLCAILSGCSGVAEREGEHKRGKVFYCVGGCVLIEADQSTDKTTIEAKKEGQAVE